jgi:hypothetical protein
LEDGLIDLLPAHHVLLSPRRNSQSQSDSNVYDSDSDVDVGEVDDSTYQDTQGSQSSQMERLEELEEFKLYCDGKGHWTDPLDDQVVGKGYAKKNKWIKGNKKVQGELFRAIKFFLRLLISYMPEDLGEAAIADLHRCAVALDQANYFMVTPSGREQLQRRSLYYQAEVDSQHAFCRTCVSKSNNADLMAIFQRRGGPGPCKPSLAGKSYLVSTYMRALLKQAHKANLLICSLQYAYKGVATYVQPKDANVSYGQWLSFLCSCDLELNPILEVTREQLLDGGSGWEGGSVTSNPSWIKNLTPENLPTLPTVLLYSRADRLDDMCEFPECYENRHLCGNGFYSFGCGEYRHCHPGTWLQNLHDMILHREQEGARKAAVSLLEGMDAGDDADRVLLPYISLLLLGMRAGHWAVWK